MSVLQSQKLLNAIAQDIDEAQDRMMYPQMETLDQLMNLQPKRIRKEERPFARDKEELENNAAKETLIDANFQRLQPARISEMIFPGENRLNAFESQLEKMMEKVIFLPQGIDKTNILKMKFDVNIPLEVQREFGITYKSENAFQLNDNNKENNKVSSALDSNLLRMNPRPDSDYLFSLVNQERLRNFKIKSKNEFYLFTDILPTKNDIDKRAEILAKLFCKYNLKDEIVKVQQKKEEEIKIKHHQQVQMVIIQKTLQGTAVTKDDLQKAQDAGKGKFENAEDLREFQNQKKKQQKLQDTTPTSDKNMDGGNNGNNSPGDGNGEDSSGQFNADGSPKRQQMQQQQNQQQILLQSQHQAKLSGGASQVLYNEQFESKINEHKQAIEQFYQNKLMKLYSKGQNERFIKCKKEFETRKQDIQNISNPEVLLRHLTQIRLLKNIF